MSYEELLRVARVAVALGVQKIRITGGEPLVRKGLIGFIAELSQLPQQPEITLTTNGVLLAGNAVALKQAGLSRINVSLDSLQPERFAEMTRRDGLDQVLQGIAAAEAAGLGPIKINMVPILGVNEDEIADFGQLTFSHPWQVRFIEFMPVSSGLEYTPEHLYSASRIQEDLLQLAPLTLEASQGIVGPARIYRLQGAQGTVGIIPAVSEHFCGDCNRLRLTADGQLRPCLFSQQEIDLLSILRQGCNDEMLAELLGKSVQDKPERHGLHDAGYTPGKRRMHGIGG